MIYLIPIISFLGFVLGNLFYYITKEEIWYSRFYFKAIQICVMLSLIGVLLYSGYFHWLVLVGLLVGFVLSELVSLWFFFGLALLVSYFVSGTVLFLISSLVFVYGLPTGTMMRRVEFDKFLELFLIFIVPLFLYFTVDYIGYEVFLGLSIGGILKNILTLIIQMKTF